MKKSAKILLILGIIVVVIAGLFAACSAYINGFPVTHKGLDYADKYRNDESGDCVYFTDEDFGEYDSITYKVKDYKGLFRSVGSAFVVTYTDEQYEKQLEAVNALDYLDTASDALPAEKVEEDGWLLRVLQSTGDMQYPKEIAMIATNDEEKTIAYLYFTDSDLDYIEETGDDGEAVMKDFIEKYFSFKF